MRATRRAWALLPGAVAATVGAWAWLADAWGALGVPLPADGVTYGDLRVIPNAAACAARDPGWSLASPPCDPAMSYYNYPSIWARSLAVLGADDAWTRPMALALILALGASLSVLAALAMRPGNEIRVAFGLSIAAVMPPVLLAGARGNVDQLIAVLLIVAAACYVRGWRVAAATIIAVSTGLKLFPIGSAIALFRDRGHRRLPLTVLAVGGALFLMPTATELAVIQARTPVLDGASFGAGLLPMAMSAQLGVGLPATGARATGLAVLVATTALLGWVLRAGRLPRIGGVSGRLAADRTASVLLATGAGAFLVAYAAGPSFDYRLLTLLLPLAALLRVGGREGTGIAALLLAVMALSYSTFIGPAEYLGDLLLLAMAPILAVLAWAAVTGRPLDRGGARSHPARPGPPGRTASSPSPA